MRLIERVVTIRVDDVLRAGVKPLGLRTHPRRPRAGCRSTGDEAREIVDRVTHHGVCPVDDRSHFQAFVDEYFGVSQISMKQPCGAPIQFRCVSSEAGFEPAGGLGANGSMGLEYLQIVR